MKSPSRIILFVDGFNGAKARVVFSGLRGNSKNSKTGAMVQSFITPLQWTKDYQTGQRFNLTDSHDVCGNCPLLSGCYVKKGHAAMGLISSAKSERGQVIDDIAELLPHIAGKVFRFGSFGEPVLLGEHNVKAITSVVAGWTGYTHQWRNPAYQWAKRYFMASVHTQAEATQAHAMGWRTFRASSSADLMTSAELTSSEVSCPASAEAGKVTTCEKCKLCMGNSRRAKSVHIVLH